MHNATAQAALEGFTEALNRVPRTDAQLSMTYDRGKEEMSAHAQLTARTGVAVYFADPHSPWQRATTRTPTGCCASICPRARTCPSTNTLIWRPSPGKLNSRPRKVLGFRTPLEVYADLLLRPTNADSAAPAATVARGPETAPRKTRPVGAGAGERNEASMRPRHYTAENVPAWARPAPPSPRFNEAAALHRGKLLVTVLSTLANAACFNEAAALHRGKLRARTQPVAAVGVASMRPRHYTAENCSAQRSSQ